MNEVLSPFYWYFIAPIALFIAVALFEMLIEGRRQRREEQARKNFIKWRTKDNEKNRL